MIPHKEARAGTNAMLYRRTDLQRAEAHVVQIRLFRWGPRERCAKRLPRLEALEQCLRLRCLDRTLPMSLAERQVLRVLALIRTVVIDLVSSPALRLWTYLWRIAPRPQPESES